MGDILKDKVALITGSGRGIGAAIANKFASEGAAIVVLDKDCEAAEAVAACVAKNHGVKTKAVCYDLRDLERRDAVVAEIKAEFGRIDILVNNAAITNENKSVMEITPEEFDEIYDNNAKAAFFFEQAVYKVMMEQKYGKIVTIGSLAEEQPAGKYAPYAIAKASMSCLAKVIAHQGGKYNITSNIICPGFIETSSTKAKAAAQDIQEIPMRRLGTEEDVAGCALFYASAFSDYITGDTIDCNGGKLMRM